MKCETSPEQEKINTLTAELTTWKNTARDLKKERDAFYNLLSAVLNDHDYCTLEDYECPVKMDCGSDGCIEYLKGEACK